MKFKLIKNLTENRMMQDKMWVFDSAIELVNFLKNKKDVFRILYDSKIDKYFVGDAEEYIHYNLLNQARKEGYYHKLEKFIDQLGDFQNYIEEGQYGTFIEDETTGKEVDLAPWLFYIVFDSMNCWSLGEDGYNDAFDTSFGSFYFRGCDISEIPELFRLLKKYQGVLVEKGTLPQSKNIDEDIWQTKTTKYIDWQGQEHTNKEEIYSPKQDSKYKRLIQKPINTLTLDEIIYIYAVHYCWYLGKVKYYDTIEQAIEDVTNNWADDFKECYDFLHSLTFPLTIYRAIRVGDFNSSEKNINTNELIISGKQSSLSWTTNPQIYTNEKSKFRNAVDIIACEINSNIIDVANTINNYMYYTNSNYISSFGEYEITLKNNFKQSDLMNLRLFNKKEG